jgi:hypothetical protein
MDAAARAGVPPDPTDRTRIREIGPTGRRFSLGKPVHRSPDSPLQKTTHRKPP